MKPSAPIRGRAAAVAGIGILALVAAGCGSSGSSGPGSSPSGGAATSSAATGAASGGASSAPASTGTGGGTDLFPIAVGETWVYDELLGRTLHGVVTDKVLNDVPVAGGHDVTISHTVKAPGLPSAPVTQTYVFHDDGSITIPFQSMTSGSTTTTVKSGSIIWPSAGDIASGQPHTAPLVLSITSGGQTTTVTSKVTVQGMGVHRLTVQAGTYNATLIREVIAETFHGFHVAITLQTWLAPGIGPVREQASSSAAGTVGIVVVDSLKSYSR